LTNSAGTRITRSGGDVTGIRREDTVQRSLENACLIAGVCDDYRGQETVVLDVTHVTPLFDFFVITSGKSRRQMHAIAESADDLMAERGSDRYGKEGFDGPWICQDYGDVVLHVFTPEARALYDLENLWADAHRIDWQKELDKLAAAST
jgi:ribosome-associated protein